MIRPTVGLLLSLLAVLGSLAADTHAQDEPIFGSEEQVDEVIELIEEIGPAEMRELIADELGWPKRKPFSHEIGPEADTLQGRLLWMVPRFSENASYPAEGIAVDLESYRVRDPEYDNFEDAVAALKSFEDLISPLIEASKLRAVPLNFDGPIPSRALPQDDPRLGIFGTTRKATRLLRVDAVRAWHAGDREGAIERAIAMIRYARPSELRGDPFMGLIQESILEYAAELVEAMAEQGLTEDEKDALGEACRTFDAEDPCQVRLGWIEFTTEMEHFVVGSIRDEQVSDDFVIVFSQHLGMMQTINAMLGVFTDAFEGIEHEDPVAAASEKGMAAIRELIRKNEELGFDELLTASKLGSSMLEEARQAWDKPNAKELLNQLDERITAEPTGLVVMMAQAPRGTHKAWAESKDHLARIHAAIED